MLEHKRPALVGMAFHADQVLAGCGADLPVSCRAVRIVAIGALDQTLVNTMAEGLLEIGLLFRVARVAERGLLAHQQVLRLAVVDGVAVGATDAVLVVHRAHEVALLGLGFVAGQAALGDVCALRAQESENLGLVGAFRVCRSGAMARLATARTMGGFGLLGGHPVRRCLEPLGQLTVARRAGLDSNVVRRGRCSRLLRSFRCLGGRRRRGLRHYRTGQQQNRSHNERGHEHDAESLFPLQPML